MGRTLRPHVTSGASHFFRSASRLASSLPVSPTTPFECAPFQRSFRKHHAQTRNAGEILEVEGCDRGIMSERRRGDYQVMRTDQRALRSHLRPEFGVHGSRGRIEWMNWVRFEYPL